LRTDDWKQLALGTQEPAKDPKTDTPDDPAKTLERITLSAEEIGDRLAKNDVSKETQQKQEQLLKDIDSLLKPPPPMNPSGGGGSSNQPMNSMPPQEGSSGGNSGMSQQNPMSMGGKNSSSGSRRTERNRTPRDRESSGKPDQQPSGTQPMPKGAQPMGTEPKGTSMGNPTTPDKTPGSPSGSTGQPQKTYEPPLPWEETLNKQVWGHLPERLRQQVSQYYKEQYMPRYQEMLKQYYFSLAEREKAAPASRR
jgi:hypothetical protein